MSTWTDTAAHQPAGGQPVQAPPVAAPGGPPRLPAPPAVVWAAAGLAVVAAVLVVIGGATGALTDLLVDLGARADDSSVVATTLNTALVAGLVGGAVGLLTGHGGGLLRVTGSAAAVLAGLAVVVGLILGEGGWQLSVFGVLLMLGAGASSVLTTRPPADWWTSATERRSAERAIERLSATPRRADTVAGRGVGSLVASVALVVGVVVVAALLVTSVAPEAVGSPPGKETSIDGAGPIPVGPGDLEYERGLALLAEECAGGDLASCDALFGESELFGEYEEYGSTCGARTARPYRGDCADSFE